MFFLIGLDNLDGIYILSKFINFLNISIMNFGKYIITCDFYIFYLSIFIIQIFHWHLFQNLRLNHLFIMFNFFKIKNQSFFLIKFLLFIIFQFKNFNRIIAFIIWPLLLINHMWRFTYVHLIIIINLLIISKNLISQSDSQFFFISVKSLYKIIISLLIKSYNIFLSIMKVTYSLKNSQPANFVEPLVKHIEECYDLQTAYGFKNILSKICQLRTKATSLNIKPESTDQELDKYSELISVYTKYALIILKRFNWDPNKGKSVQGVQLTWYDSFQTKLQYKKNLIVIDIFSCFYNLAVIYFTRSLKLSQVDLDGSRKQAVNKAKFAAYLLKEMKEKYYSQFVNAGWNDTQYAHLDMLQSLCLGIIYKCLYNTFKNNQYKLGIHKIAAICKLINTHYYKAYSVGSQFFLNPSGITQKTKVELLSMSYIESLYFDVMANVKFAKYYANLMEKDHSHISKVIAYQKKAKRLIQLGLKNQSVQQLFNQNKQQKTQLTQLQNQIQASLTKNIERNKQIYKQPQIQQNQIPPPEEVPPEWIAKLVIPPNLIMADEGQFAKLMSEQAYILSLEFVNFSNSRKVGLESSQKKLDQQIQKSYNQNYINFYLQIQNETKQKTIPKVLQEKLLQIRKKGGRNKLEMDVTLIKTNQQNFNKSFLQIKQQLNDEESFDNQKKNQYGNKWSRQPSKGLNKDYFKKIQSLQAKYKIAVSVDEKILEKFNRNKLYIESINSDEQIIKNLPKPQVSKFLEANKLQLTKLKQKSDVLKKRRDNIVQIGLQILESLQKMNYPKLANQYLTQQISKEDIFKTVFKDVQALINKFNEQCKNIKDEVQIISNISLSLNAKNKEQEGNKREFQTVVGSYNQILQLFSETEQGTNFYTKLSEHVSRLTSEVEDFIYARKLSAEDLENNLNKKTGGFTNNLPQMYPGQNIQNFPQYVPPPPPPSFFQQSQGWGQSGFYGGYNNPVNQGYQMQGNNQFQSGFQQPLNFPNNPFEGPIFPSGYHKK